MISLERSNRCSRRCFGQWNVTPAALSSCFESGLRVPDEPPPPAASLTWPEVGSICFKLFCPLLHLALFEGFRYEISCRFSNDVQRISAPRYYCWKRRERKKGATPVRAFYLLLFFFRLKYRTFLFSPGIFFRYTITGPSRRDSTSSRSSGERSPILLEFFPRPNEVQVGGREPIYIYQEWDMEAEGGRGTTWRRQLRWWRTFLGGEEQQNGEWSQSLK